jgi:16S rRNA (cytosine1402-N4)-methyltransferase
MSPPFKHQPVLLKEVLELLGPKDHGIYVDATFGRGGYTQAFLEAASCQVLALDRDAQAIEAGQPLTDHYKGRLTLAHARFSELLNVAALHGIQSVQGIVFDLGVSSPQLDEASRGFSFQQEGPLDMRMGLNKQTAADVVNSAPEKLLADIFWHYGGERRSRALARAIVADRQTLPFTTTQQLASLARRVVKQDASGIDAATRTFQGLRIYINNELEELWEGLCASETLLAPGGVLVVVSFHSGEDAFVKDYFLILGGHRKAPQTQEMLTPRLPSFRCLQRKPLRSSLEECKRNPRARSARLRWGERTTAPGWADKVRA